MYGTARLSPRTRSFLVDESRRIGVSVAARHVGTTRRTVYRWRLRAGSYEDRSSRPRRSPHRTPDALEATVLAIRLERRWGPDRIAGELGMHVSTVHRILRRHGVHRLSHVFPLPPRSFGRFDVRAPGELVAIDTKQLGRLDRGGGRAQVMHHSHRGRWKRVGWRHLHVAIDFASRVVFAELRDSDVAPDTTSFLDHALAFFDAQGIRVRRVLSDNGSGYKRTFHEYCQSRGLRHSRIKPRHPWTNGRVERFIGTAQRECLYAGAFFTSEDQRALALWLWLAYYNRERPHIALGGLAPMQWLSRRRGVTEVRGDLT
jgi:transposase InsO family protein